MRVRWTSRSDEVDEDEEESEEEMGRSLVALDPRSVRASDRASVPSASSQHVWNEQAHYRRSDRTQPRSDESTMRRESATQSSSLSPSTRPSSLPSSRRRPVRCLGPQGRATFQPAAQTHEASEERGSIQLHNRRGRIDVEVGKRSGLHR